jgi:hypothetical protein
MIIYFLEYIQIDMGSKIYSSMMTVFDHTPLVVKICGTPPGLVAVPKSIASLLVLIFITAQLPSEKCNTRK